MLRPVNTVRHNSSLWRRLALACVLLWANATGFAHEPTHDLHGEPEICLNCAFGGPLEDGASGASNLELERPEGLADHSSICIKAALAPRHKAPARAPPESS